MCLLMSVNDCLVLVNLSTVLGWSTKSHLSPDVTCSHQILTVRRTHVTYPLMSLAQQVFSLRPSRLLGEVWVSRVCISWEQSLRKPPQAGLEILSMREDIKQQPPFLAISPCIYQDVPWRRSPFQGSLGSV